MLYELSLRVVGLSFVGRPREQKGDSVKAAKMLVVRAPVATISCGRVAMSASAVALPEGVSGPALVQEDVDLQAVEAEVKTIFERYLHRRSDGRWSVDIGAVRQDGAPEAELQRIAERINTPIGQYVFPDSEDKESSAEGAAPEHQFGSWDWAKCVLNIVVPGTGTMLLDGGIRGLLAKGKYAQVASWLLRVVGRSANRGGAIGLVASLAAAAGWCSASIAS